MRTIIHPSDFSKGDEGACAHALKIGLANQAEVTILHIDQSSSAVAWCDFPSVQKMLMDWGMQNVGPEAIAQAGLRVTPVRHYCGDPGQTILDYIHAHPPDLLVLATHQRRGFSRWFHSALAEPIARAASVQTLFVPRRVEGFVAADGSIRLETIIIPVDFAPNPQTAVDAAAALAASLHCRKVHFLLLHLGQTKPMPQIQPPPQPTWTLEGLSQPEWTTETLTDPGRAVGRVLSLARSRKADLIVMSTAAHRGFLEFLRGNAAERVLRAAHCPVLSVPETI